MPKPFKKLHRFDPNAIKERPQLLNHIGIIATMWTHVEFALSRLLSQLLGAEPVVGTAMYLTLRGQPLRDEVMKAAAEVSLPTELNEKLCALIKMTKSPREARNNIVHGFWAISDEDKDCLVLVDHKNMALMFSFGAKGSSVNASSEEMQKFGEIMNAQISLEYKEEDFIEIERMISKALDRIGELHNELSQYFKKRA